MSGKVRGFAAGAGSHPPSRALLQRVEAKHDPALADLFDLLDSWFGRPAASVTVNFDGKAPDRGPVGVGANCVGESVRLGESVCPEELSTRARPGPTPAATRR